jgi:hypothetical protein
MIHYRCGSCSYQSDQLDEAQQHSGQTGHVCVGTEDARPAEGKLGKAKVLLMAGAGAVAAVGAGVFAWKCKALQAENEELQTENEGLLSMAAGLVVQLAESTAENESLRAENEYLKSPSGAGKTLKGHHHT